MASKLTKISCLVCGKRMPRTGHERSKTQLCNNHCGWVLRVMRDHDLSIEKAVEKVKLAVLKNR